MSSCEYAFFAKHSQALACFVVAETNCGARVSIPASLAGRLSTGLLYRGLGRAAIGALHLLRVE